MRNVLSYVVVLFLSVAIVGCGGRKAVDGDVNVEAVDGTAGASTGGLAGDGVSSSGLDDGSTGLGGAMGANGPEGELLSKRVVYFDYNSSLLTLESEAIVQAHAQFLASNSGVQIILEGHADERGTREYNLALGEDRAKSVANVMEALGVSGGRIQNVSYGEERPVALGYDEAAFALNRRVEILYQ
ncbi:MAG: peptidoglycan-associated lipoprotein Pal [Acidiferrobacterales bacterium]|nr:peptidoglycan-associated lipoprotein Pal [Acidiferrobacterales bacterium]